MFKSRLKGVKLKARQEHKSKRWTSIHYNAIAKEIRELFPITPNDEYNEVSSSEWVQIEKEENAQRTVLVNLAINLAKRFMQDSDEAVEGYVFDPIKFLNACSPNLALYPLGDLWEV